MLLPYSETSTVNCQLSTVNYQLSMTEMRKINLIIIHCTASRPNQHVTLEMLHQMHRARGWKQCGGYFNHLDCSSL